LYRNRQRFERPVAVGLHGFKPHPPHHYVGFGGTAYLGVIYYLRFRKIFAFSKSQTILEACFYWCASAREK
jgi:hypothetical protein